MKRLIVTFVAAVATAIVAAAETNAYKKLDAKTATVEECRAALDHVMTATNVIGVARAIFATGLLSVDRSPSAAGIVNELDDKLAAKFLKCSGYSERFAQICSVVSIAYHADFPKTSDVLVKALGLDTRYPNITTVYKRLNPRGALVATSLFSAGADLDDFISILAEMTYPGGDGTMLMPGPARLNSFRKYIQKRAAKEIRSRLRKKGISFVTKNGVNPCDAYLTRLSDALNAPRVIGLNQWLADLGYTARIDESRMISEQSLSDLKSKIFYGEWIPSSNRLASLLIGLGTEEYNKFIKEYNGDK